MLFRELLNESYKLTFKDKQAIDKIVKNKYEKYKSHIEDKNEQIKHAKRIMNAVKGTSDEKAFIGSHFDFEAKLDIEKPVLYNKFYKDNYESIKDDYVKYARRNSFSDFEFKSKQSSTLKRNNEKGHYTESEQKNIDSFINLVGVRVNSGTGESISRKKIRDAFFKTPTSFQKKYAEKPSPYLWRGDYEHPCSDDYDHNDKNYLSMQSFSTSKHTAQEFGSHFNAMNIKSYSGCFSLQLFLEYGDYDNLEFGDDEGEVMFFDVIYKCKKGS